MIIGRFMMRLLLVPLGGCVAICVAMLFVMLAHWNRVAALTTGDANGLMEFVMVGPMLAASMAFMLLPATLAAMLAEAFAIRSLLYYAVCGGLSAGVSLATIGGLDKDYNLADAPLIAVGAGIVAGFAYWAVAGWSAGFWKPVFAPPAPADAPPPMASSVTEPVALAPASKSENEIAGQNPAIRNSAIRLND
jgi:hypothetical protein